jgi:hypothetical protein
MPAYTVHISAQSSVSNGHYWLVACSGNLDIARRVHVREGTLDKCTRDRLRGTTENGGPAWCGGDRVVGRGWVKVGHEGMW